jgi:hypothetical protein
MSHIPPPFARSFPLYAPYISLCCALCNTQAIGCLLSASPAAKIGPSLCYRSCPKNTAQLSAPPSPTTPDISPRLTASSAPPSDALPSIGPLYTRSVSDAFPLPRLCTGPSGCTPPNRRSAPAMFPPCSCSAQRVPGRLMLFSPDTCSYALFWYRYNLPP